MSVKQILEFVLARVGFEIGGAVTVIGDYRVLSGFCHPS